MTIDLQAVTMRGPPDPNWFPMRIAVLSDIHLAPNPINRCAVDLTKLAGRVDRLIETHDEVILNGDTFDLSRSLTPWGWRAHLAATRSEHSDLCATLDRATWLQGNHDVQLASIGAESTWHGAFDGLRVFVHHGHVFDTGLKRFRSIEWSANLAAGWAARVGLDVVERGMELISNTSERVTSGSEPDVAGARRLIENGWDIVIQGHAHLQRLEELAGGLYLNTGSQLGDAVEWGSVDTETGRVLLMRDDEIVSEAQAIRTTRR